MRGLLRLARQRRFQHGLYLFVVMFVGLAGAWGRVRKGLMGEVTAPLGHRLRAHLVALSNGLALVAPGTIQDDAGPYAQGCFRIAAPAHCSKVCFWSSSNSISIGMQPILCSLQVE